MNKQKSDHKLQLMSMSPHVISTHENAETWGRKIDAAGKTARCETSASVVSRLTKRVPGPMRNGILSAFLVVYIIYVAFIVRLPYRYVRLPVCPPTLFLRVAVDATLAELRSCIPPLPAASSIVSYAFAPSHERRE
jgi:hypothetical protein